MADTVTYVPRTAARTASRRSAFGRSLIWYLVTIAIAIVVLYPIAWMVLSTFKPSSEVVGNTNLIPETFTFKNYATISDGIAGVPLARFMWNSFLLSSLTVIGTLASCSISAYAFTRIKFRGRGIFFACMIATLLLPTQVLIIPQYIIFQKMDLIGTYLPLLLGKFLAVEGFFVFLMVQFIRGIPRDLDEAATIDGCGHGRIFFSIILPLMKPSLVTAAIFSFIWTWNDFLGPLLYLNDPETYPMTMALRMYNDQTSTSDYGATITMSVVALLPVFIFFLIFQRFLVEGVATQGLKG